MSDQTTPPQSPKLKAAIAKSTVLQNGKANNNPFGSFFLLPYNAQFDVQHEDEHVLLLLRQHFIVNTGWIILTAFLLFLLPALVFAIFPSLFGILPLSYRMVVTLAYYIVVLGYAFERFVMWYYNIYIVTDERIIDVDFYSLLFKRVSDAKLDHIQDLTAASGGVIQSFFDYGDVQIQTSAEIPELEFENVPKPDVVVKLVSELIDKESVEDTGHK